MTSGANTLVTGNRPGWSREFRYLLSACRTGNASNSFDGADSSNLNWKRVVELAATHRVLPQLHQRLACAPVANCPDDLRASVHSRTRHLLHRSLLLSAELIRVVGLMQRKGVNCLTFKGPTLGKLAYGKLSNRTFSDVDVLVSEADTVNAIECLAELGYKSYEDLSLDQQLFQMKSKGEILFANPNGGFVDLHTSLNRGTYAYRVSWNQLWDNRQMVDIDGTSLATFGAEDLCLYLAIHGAKHRWSQLNWILDFAQTIQIFDPERVQTAANAIGERKVFQLAFLICEAALGLPDAKAARLAGIPDRRQARLLDHLHQNLESGNCPVTRVSDLTYLFRARQRPIAAILATIAEITTPHLTDWNAVRLPRVLWFCYVIIRPIRLFWKRLT